MASLSYAVNGGPPTTVTGESTQITPVPTGITTYTVTATDLVGNVSSPTTITTHVDGTTPSASVTFPANGGTYNASGWTNGGTSPCGAAGTICGQATDTGGGGIPGANAITLTITNPGGMSWNGTSFASGTNTVNPTTYNAATGLWTYTFPTGNLVPNGTYSVAAQATGVVENVSSVATNTFVFDATPPSVAVTSPVSGSTYGPNWSGTISGTRRPAAERASPECGLAIENTTTGKWWNGTSFSATSQTFVAATGTTSWTYGLAATNLATGDAYSVTAQATDSATNVGTSTPNTFTYSTAAPKAAVTYPVSGTTYGPNWSGTISGTASASGGTIITGVGVAIENTTTGKWWNGIGLQRDEPDLRRRVGDDQLVPEPERHQPDHR